MRTKWLFALLLVAGCQQQEPENGVDTTLPAEPAKISGSLTAPIGYLPSDIKVCVETVAGKTVSCAAKVDSSVFSGTYEIEVPAGAYRVYAATSEVPGYKAYYLDCSSQPNCHVPGVVKVAEGDTATGIDPNDWGNRLAPAQPSGDPDYGLTTTDMNATDMNVDENLTTTDDTQLDQNELDQAFPRGSTQPE